MDGFTLSLASIYFTHCLRLTVPVVDFLKESKQCSNEMQDDIKDKTSHSEQSHNLISKFGPTLRIKSPPTKDLAKDLRSSFPEKHFSNFAVSTCF